VFLLWIFATAVKITLPPLPACKGHVPGINPESLRLAPRLGIADGTNTEQDHCGDGCVLPVLEIPWSAAGLSPVPGSTTSASWGCSYQQDLAKQKPIPPGQMVISSQICFWPSAERSWEAQICKTSFGDNSVYWTDPYCWSCAWFFPDKSWNQRTSFQAKHKQRLIECLKKWVSVRSSLNEKINCA